MSPVEPVATTPEPLELSELVSGHAHQVADAKRTRSRYNAIRQLFVHLHACAILSNRGGFVVGRARKQRCPGSGETNSSQAAISGRRGTCPLLADGKPYIPVFAVCHALGIPPDIHIRCWR